MMFAIQRSSLFLILIGLAVVLIEMLLPAAPSVRHGLALLVVIAALWITETLHITLTALLVPVLAVGTGLLDVRAAFSEFANPIIFLFLGGFALASALHKQGIDQHLALQVLRLSGGRPVRAVLWLAAMTAFLSMWISNTAATAIMLPLVIGLVGDRRHDTRSRMFALLAVAYSASIGGIATLVGSPPNAIVAAQLDLSFADWLQLGMPVSLLLWPLMLVALYAVLKPSFAAPLSGGSALLAPATFEWTTGRKQVVVIFAVTVVCWLFSSALGEMMGVTRYLDAWIAMSALFALAVTRTINWKDIDRTTDWGVLLLFGGGLTLSAVLKASGTSAWLGQLLGAGVSDWPAILILLAVTTFVVFLTELSSNTATAALLLPLFLSLPETLVPPLALAMAIGISASCAFMLPVATPPNALVYGTGLVSQKVMMRAGLVLNLMCCVVIVAWTHWGVR